MDKILEIYLVATNTIALVSLVGFVVLISNKISQKNSFKIASSMFLILTIIGMYLYIPSRFFILGALNQKISYLETAIRISINPIEKKLCREILGNIENNYITPEISEMINKIKKADLLFFELQNTYNVKKQELGKKLKK